MATNKYTFDDSTSPTYQFKLPSSSHSRRRKNSYDEENGSLTYSAASSINSKGSKESTDSSFAEIRRALEAGGDSKDLAAFLKHYNLQRDEKSVGVESLAYSTDAESHLRSYYGGGADSLAYSADNESFTMRSMATGADSHLQGSAFVSAGCVVSWFGRNSGETRILSVLVAHTRLSFTFILFHSVKAVLNKATPGMSHN